MGKTTVLNPKLKVIGIVGYCGSPETDKELYKKRMEGLRKQVHWAKNLTRGTGTKVYVAMYRAADDEIRRLTDGDSDHVKVYNYGENVGPGGFRNKLRAASIMDFREDDRKSPGWMLYLDCGDTLTNSFETLGHYKVREAIDAALGHAELCGARVLCPVQIQNDHSMIDQAQQDGEGYAYSSFVPGPAHFVYREDGYDLRACKYDEKLFPMVDGKLSPGEDFEIAVQYMSKGWKMITAQFLHIIEHASSKVGSPDSLWSNKVKHDRDDVIRKIADKHFTGAEVKAEYESHGFDAALSMLYSKAKEKKR